MTTARACSTKRPRSSLPARGPIVGYRAERHQRRDAHCPTSACGGGFSDRHGQSVKAGRSAAAAEAGVGPRVVHHDAGSGALVLEWIDGRTMSNEAFAEPGMPARIAAAIRLLHAGPRFRDDFDMVRLSERYLRVVDERGIPIPAGCRERLPRIPRIEAAL